MVWLEADKINVYENYFRVWGPISPPLLVGEYILGDCYGRGSGRSTCDAPPALASPLASLMPPPLVCVVAISFVRPHDTIIPLEKRG